MNTCYNLGDKVKVIGDKFGKGYFIGTEGTITDVKVSESNTWYIVKLEKEYTKGKNELPFMFVELETI